MSGLADVLVALAVVVLIVIRQIRPQRVTPGRRWWVVPAVLVVFALRSPGTHGFIDAQRPLASGLLLAAELVTGLLMGAAWAWTSRVWTESDGSVWARGTKATTAVWIGGIALRLGLAGLGALIGVRQGTGALLLALAVSLLVRSGILVWRARSVSPVPGQAAAYGDGVQAASRKDPV